MALKTRLAEDGLMTAREGQNHDSRVGLAMARSLTGNHAGMSGATRPNCMAVLSKSDPLKE
jgi:hypothetical protein